MIIYGDETSYENAEIGDEFCVIEYMRYSTTPCSVRNYTVKKIGKRDIKCVSSDGSEIIVKVRNTYSNPMAYKVDGEERKLAIDSIRKKNRLQSALKLIEGREAINKFDDLLLTAIEEWSARIKVAEVQS